MEFSESNAIYLQIAHHGMERILKGVWSENERIPSVRDMAIDVAVNPNTVMRAYTFLESKNIIHNQRGIGYFVSQNASSIIQELRKQEFIDNDLPKLFRSMNLLKIGIDEIQRRYQEYTKQKTATEGTIHETK